MVRFISLDRGDIGTRVDRVLLRHLHDVPGISRNRIQRLISSGAVRVNDQPAPRAAWRIAAGDRLSIELSDTPPRTGPAAEALPLEVLYEDDDLLVVNKPAGQVSHPAFRNSTGTLLNALLAHAGGKWRPALLGRLDKDTSGLVLVAKHARAQAALQQRMQRHGIEKDYVAIVKGRPVPVRGTIDLALDRDPWDRRRVIVRDKGGQPSVTTYERLVFFAGGGISLVRCRLITGRTHQIRVHLAARGWPILGDATYGTNLRTREPENLRTISRQALHAWRLAFDHPFTRKRIDVTAPIPADMQALIDAYSSLANRASTVPSAE